MDHQRVDEFVTQPLGGLRVAGRGEHVAVELEARVGADLALGGLTHERRILLDGDRDVHDQRRRLPPGPLGAATQRRERLLREVGGRADPRDRAVRQLAAQLEGLRVQRGGHDRRVRGRHAGAGAHVAALEVDLTLVQQRAQHGQVLAELRQRRVERHAEGAHRPLRARADAEAQAAGRDGLDGGDLLRDEDGVARPRGDDRAAHQHALRAGGRVREERQRVGAGAPTLQPDGGDAGPLRALDQPDGLRSRRLDGHADDAVRIVRHGRHATDRGERGQRPIIATRSNLSPRRTARPATRTRVRGSWRPGASTTRGATTAGASARASTRRRPRGSEAAGDVCRRRINSRAIVRQRGCVQSQP